MNIARSYKNWRSFRNTIAELERLSNRDLSDLGITRADIRSVARSSVR